VIDLADEGNAGGGEIDCTILQTVLRSSTSMLIVQFQMEKLVRIVKWILIWASGVRTQPNTLNKQIH
jgi:hypothetical protein